MSLEIDPKSASDRVLAGAFLLDVREPDEWQEVHVAAARLIPLGELPQRLTELPTDRDIICMCRSGRRSEKAQALIAQRKTGAPVMNMTGGILQWIADGLPVVKDEAP